MCVGCRAREERSALVRFVAVESDGELVARPDPRRRLPGRGAWMHPDPDCLAAAERRRAIGRALRVASIDLRELTAYLESTAR